MESTGFKFAAFFAGKYPKLTPTITENENAMKTE